MPQYGSAFGQRRLPLSFPLPFSSHTAVAAGAVAAGAAAAHSGGAKSKTPEPTSEAKPQTQAQPAAQEEFVEHVFTYYCAPESHVCLWVAYVCVCVCVCVVMGG